MEPDDPGWSALGSGLSCVSDDCNSTYANAVDAAPSGIFVVGNFGIAVSRTRTFALGDGDPGVNGSRPRSSGGRLSRPAVVLFASLARRCRWIAMSGGRRQMTDVGVLLAAVTVADLDGAVAWYARLFGRPRTSSPMTAR